MRTHHVSIQMLVPLAELQAILPAGFSAIANPAGSTTAQVALTFIYQQRTELTGQGTFGPGNSVFVGTTATNTALSRREGLQLAVYGSDQGLVDAQNSNFGPGSSRLADIDLDFTEKDGSLSFKGTVDHAGTHFKIEASAECHDPIDVRLKSDPTTMPSTLPVRFLNNGATANPSFRIASQLDSRTLPFATAQAKVTPTHGPLRLPGGDVTISSLGPSVIFGRWIEITSKRE